ncbi:MAG TPA: RNA 2',3'-cyclic phosphodiesterase [Thermoanaerobaculia bacterium]|nr:RNA 2',3'-cyclic phosphodiesterase [Thermoanaerobaculia bacterium]
MRLFIATTFPSHVLQSVNDRVAKVRSKLPPSSWVRPESQHLTFAFLGEHPDSLVDRLAALLTPRLGEHSAFEARLHGCGFFPNSRHARVGWLGVAPEEPFRAVAESVRDCVREAGVQLDGSDFRAHLTLLRVRDRWPPACIEIFHKALGSYESETFRVEKVTLYSSQLNPSGAVHTALRHFALRGVGD